PWTWSSALSWASARPTVSVAIVFALARMGWLPEPRDTGIARRLAGNLGQRLEQQALRGFPAIGGAGAVIANGLEILSHLLCRVRPARRIIKRQRDHGGLGLACPF